jgi:hypothetical protein
MHNEEFNKLSSDEMREEVKFEMALFYLRKKKLLEEKIKVEREKLLQEKTKKMQGKGKSILNIEYN